MEENQNLEEQITRHLLAREIQHTDKVRVEDHLADGGEGTSESHVSSVTGVLLFSCFIAVCGSFNYGLAVGYSSPVESEILDDLGLSTTEYSLFGSILTTGGALGAIACGEMSDFLGRRGTFGVADVLSITGWVAIVASQGVLPLYLGRILLGIALGITSYVVPVYIAEIAPRDVRGGFVILHMVMTCAGIAIAFILGAFISWRVLAAVGIDFDSCIIQLFLCLHIKLLDGTTGPFISTAGIIPNLSQLICLVFIPESPRWLVKAHKENKLKATLQRLRGSNANISVEAADIRVYTEALEQTSKASIFELFQWKYAYTLTVGIGLFTLSNLVGSNAIIYYASSIFESAGFSSTVGSIVMALVMLLFVSISSLLTDRFGRRPLLMISASGTCLGCLLASISFVFEDHGWLEGFSPYLTLTGLMIFCAFYVIGIGGISFLLISEIYPISIKGLAGSLATFVGWVTSGFVAYAFNFSMEWSSAGTFFILTGMCALTLLFVVKLVPETKGRSLEEIQASVNQTQ